MFFFPLINYLLLVRLLRAGIMFQDITTLLLDPKAFKDTIDMFVERYKGKNISVVAGKKHEDLFIYWVKEELREVGV